LHKPPHILCHGFLRCGAANPDALREPDPTTIPGLLINSPNDYVRRLRTKPWNLLPSLLGKESSKVLNELFIECGIFLPLGHGQGNLLQISGTVQVLFDL